MLGERLSLLSTGEDQHETGEVRARRFPPGPVPPRRQPGPAVSSGHCRLRGAQRGASEGEFNAFSRTAAGCVQVMAAWLAGGR